MVFVVKDIIVIFRKIKTILILISFKRYFSHPELKSSLTLRMHFNSGLRSLSRDMLFPAMWHFDEYRLR